MKSIFVAAIIAAACSGVALAGDAKQDQKTTQTPTIKATQMSDAEMDKVTAGGSHANPHPNENASIHACNRGNSSRIPFC
jgi:hypothetical protein